MSARRGHHAPSGGPRQGEWQVNCSPSASKPDDHHHRRLISRLTTGRSSSTIDASFIDKETGVQSGKQRRGTWLNVIGWVLAGILVFDVLSVPLLVFGHGAPMVGAVNVGAVF